MHGVEVTAGSRYSLVLWLSDCAESVRAGATPWLKVEADRGDVYAQFLYAEARRYEPHPPKPPPHISERISISHIEPPLSDAYAQFL
eukprot:scaffold10714_cov157-Isochrysis_galbana.AAC.1